MSRWIAPLAGWLAIVAAVHAQSGFFKEDACSCSYFPASGSVCVRSAPNSPGLCVESPCDGGHKCRHRRRLRTGPLATAADTCFADPSRLRF
jgi:hypothetical protein